MSSDFSSQALTDTPAPKPRITILVWALGCSGLLVVALGLAATLIVPSVLKKLSQAYDGRIRADLRMIDAALDLYAKGHGDAYPDSLEALSRPDADGFVYFKEPILDPWHRPYIYEPPKTPGAFPRVLTYGHDGQPGGTDLDADVDDSTIRAR